VRSVPATLVAFVLLLMLSVTTPMGVGDGVHSSVLLHPLFSHTHVVDGRVISHEQLADASTAPAKSSRGLAIGAEAGASAASGAMAISPTLPLQDLRLDMTEVMRYPAFGPAQPHGLVIAPPDPPPTLSV
jgi:hypothetical protein